MRLASQRCSTLNRAILSEFKHTASPYLVSNYFLIRAKDPHILTEMEHEALDMTALPPRTPKKLQWQLHLREEW